MTVRGEGALGLLPGVAPGLGLAADFFSDSRAHLMIGMLWLPEVRTADERFGFGLAAGWVAGCLDAWRFARGAVGGCVGVLAGAVHSVSYALEPSDQENGNAWVAGSLTAWGRLTLVGPLTADLGIEAIVPAIRRHYLARNETDPVFEPWPVAVPLSVGLGVTFL